MFRPQRSDNSYTLFSTTLVTGDIIPKHLRYRPRTSLRIRLPNCCPKEIKHPAPPEGKVKHQKCQTMYREAEVQTVPYAVDLIDNYDRGLEILTLGWLLWDNGLPVGMHEIETIERVRQRVAYEAALPQPKDNESINTRKMIIETIEANEWAFRDAEIEALNTLRMELASKVMNERKNKNQKYLEIRLKRFQEVKDLEREEKLKKIRRKFERSRRKLFVKLEKRTNKYIRWNIVDEHADKTSELYGPQMRFGVNPRFRHEVIHPDDQYSRMFSCEKILQHTLKDVPLKKPCFDANKHSNLNKPRSVKFSVNKLNDLLSAFKSGAQKKHIKCDYSQMKHTLKPKIAESEMRKEISAIFKPAEIESDLEAIFLQQIIKGRAIQSTMFESRVTHQEEIEEFRIMYHTHKQFKSEKQVVDSSKRSKALQVLCESRKQEILSKLEGMTTGAMLDFLAKESIRLEDERVLHAYALLAYRETQRREAEDIKLQHLEKQRRQELDLIFQQIVKVTQNTVDLFLEDIIIKSEERLGDEESRKYIQNIARLVDQTAHEAHIRSEDLEAEEIVADLVYNFALPEAEKRIVRMHIKKKQKNYVKEAHDLLYGKIEEITGVGSAVDVAIQ